MEKETEVIVAGGGIAGTAIAYYLAKAGKDVILLEKADLTRGSSVANAAFAWISYRKPGPPLQIGLASLESYEEISKKHDIEFERVGGLSLFETEDLFEKMKPYVEVRNKAGLPKLRLINKSELSDLEPHLAPFLVGAMYNPTDAHINPMYTVYAYADEAKWLGARIYTGTEVVGINVEKGHVKSVITNKGEIKTRYIVNACGIHAPVLGRMVGLDIPITPQREQLLITEEIPKIVSRPMFTASYKESVEREVSAAFILAFLANPVKKGNLILGGANSFVGEDTSVTFEAFEAISQEAIRYLPILKTLGVRVIRSFAKFYIHTPDITPIIGKVKGLGGFLIASGFNDYGMGVGPGVGKIISELICFGESSIPLEEFSLSRFEK